MQKLAKFEKVYSTVFMNLNLTKVAVERTTCEFVWQVRYQAESEYKSERKKQDIDKVVR